MTDKKPMNADLFRRWLSALRSGKYPRQIDSLRSPRGFSSRGVLCDVADPDGWTEDAGLWRWRGEIWRPGDLFFSLGWGISFWDSLRVFEDAAKSHAEFADLAERRIEPAEQGPFAMTAPPPPEKKTRKPAAPRKGPGKPENPQQKLLPRMRGGPKDAGQKPGGLDDARQIGH